MPTTVAVYTPDLMDRSKISSAAPDARFVSSPDALVGLAGVDAVVVDLNKKGVLEALPAIVASIPRVLAYGRHVDAAILAAAKEAGCGEVMTRSDFFARLPELLG